MNERDHVSGYLHQEVLKKARYLVITVDRHGLVAKQECPGIGWRFDSIRTGAKLPEALQSIIDSGGGSNIPQLYPFVNLEADITADVHVLHHGEEHQLILQDVSEGHDEEHKLQQKAHEVSLLLEQQESLSRELDRQRHEAEEASRAKSRFIASMSHEFRSPLSTIMAHADALRKILPGEQGPQAIHRASWYLLTMIENLLEQARMGEGHVNTISAPLDLQLLCSDMSDLFTVQAKQRNLALEVHCDVNDGTFLSDELRLRQVLINLLSNALRYTEQGKVSLHIEEDESGVNFRVVDSGVGIAADQLETVFKPFERLEQSQQKGAGLGLTISQQLVEALGGSLAVDSEPGQGSTFQFKLPRTDISETMQPGDLTDTRILLVEDDPDLRDLYQVILSDWGMQVQTATSVAEAELAIENHIFDVVMTDHFLGDGTGVSLLQSLGKSQPKAKRIMCSGAAAIAQNELEMTEVSDVLLSKPVAPAHLQVVLSKTVRAGHSS